MMSNVPKLRFKEFSGENNGLNEYIFEEIFSFSTGKNIKQNEASPDFDIPCVRYGELYHMYGEVISKVYNKTNLDKSELLFSNGNEILMPSAGEDPLDIGSASALTIKNVAIGRTINIMRPLKENVYSQKYVSYFINEKLRKKISTLAKGSSISNVYNSDLKKLKIRLPQLEEQEKIASFLTSVDTKIQLLSKKEELLSLYKKGVMQKIFSGEIRFKADDGSEFEDWEEKKFSEFMELPDNIKSNTPEKDKLLTVKLHQKGIFKSKNTESLSMGATYYVRYKGQFIYGKQNLFNGAFGIIPDAFDSYLSSTDVPTLNFKVNLINPSYFLLFLGRTEYYKRLESFASGSGSKRIHEKTLLDLKATFPCLDEQTKIANFLTSIDTKIEQTQNQLSSTKEFKKALLQQMFV